MQIKTSDLYFAAFLQCKGCKIVKTEKQGPKCTFIFEETEEIESFKDAYFNESSESSIPCLSYANAVRSLKTLCYVHN
jgi:Domain of unknown function (DUF5659)